MECEANLTETVAQVNGFIKAVRVKLSRNGNKLMAHPLKGQLSTVLSSLAQADGYALIPAGMSEIVAGSTVTVLARRERVDGIAVSSGEFDGEPKRFARGGMS
jgi:molybdopterin biosynthesis enzyme